ncbi:urease accessory protein UreF [Rhodotorula paludigena]|uniref:urease accessory protein UreF n=1 Tax=Rhodotorula paludigena TaxID=86838 RepID=UPI00316F1361
MGAGSPSSSLEQYLLVLLSDSNLPTGGFVASSGLESWIQHGYLSLPPPARPSNAPSPTPRPRPPAEASLLAFVALSLHSYARLNVPFLRAAHSAVSSLRPSRHPDPTPSTSSSASSASPATAHVDAALSGVLAADALCEAMTLNHVARRASTAQGVALLTLYERALAPLPGEGGPSDEDVKLLVRRYRAAVRTQQHEAGSANGHMSVAFAVLTAAVGLSLEASLSLFLFLHARSLLSSAVRVNTVGPYLAHRMLLWDVRPLVDEAVAATSQPVPEAKQDSAALEMEEQARAGGAAGEGEEDDWWDNDPFWRGIWDDDVKATAAKPTPVVTWPLGEIVATRHDQLFTRVFNS